MHSASRTLLGRARRLTDTTETKVESSKADFAAAEAGSIGALHKGSSPELLSVISCYGEGMDQNTTAIVGQLKATYSVHTQPGADPGGNTKDNQDAWCVQERLGGQDMLLFGVFDGHGQEGKVVSHTICQNLPKIMARLVGSRPPPSIETALSAAFPEANASLKKRPGLDADLSGSTGIVALVHQSRLVAANLGDSRCVLGKVDAHGAVTAVALSSDHTPMDAKEAERIIATGGRIASFMCGDEPLGPPRVWLREVNIPGLCMTRSFGDYVAASVGVIDQPQLMAATLKPEDKYVVLMSDGIFEFLDSQQVMEEVHAAARAGQSPSEAAKRLVRLARKCWQEQEDDIIDDCTAMVIYLSPAHSGGSAGGSTASAAALAARLENNLRIGSTPGSGSHGALGYKRGV
uniref:protein-serine/threonine phosphatase n=1 Tax=Tetradesmus obliquus TaxID=3088 RepID=A0A383VYJ0_TETOB|eukprot:jgi/Sobl393_1/11150/SZX74657.1